MKNRITTNVLIMVGLIVTSSIIAQDTVTNVQKQIDIVRQDYIKKLEYIKKIYAKSNRSKRSRDAANGSYPGSLFVKAGRRAGRSKKPSI